MAVGAVVVCRCGSGWTSLRIPTLSSTSTSPTSSTRVCRWLRRRSWTAAQWWSRNCAKTRPLANCSTLKTFQSSGAGSNGTYPFRQSDNRLVAGGNSVNGKCAQRRRKHCVLTVVRRSQKDSPHRDPLLGGIGRPKFNQLETVTTFTYKSSLVRIDARNFELSW